MNQPDRHLRQLLAEGLVGQLGGLALQGIGLFDQLREIVAAVNVPVQAVGGLCLEQAIATPEYGDPVDPLTFASG